MTTAAHFPWPVFMPAGQIPPQSTTDLTFDPKETCARCGPGTQAQSKWVFRQISERTGIPRAAVRRWECLRFGFGID